MVDPSDIVEFEISQILVRLITNQNEEASYDTSINGFCGVRMTIQCDPGLGRGVLVPLL